jgi:hypothetical protein
MENDMKTLLNDISALFDIKLQPINDRLSSLEQGQKEIKMTLENDIKPKIQMLFEEVVDIKEKISDIPQMKDDINDIKLDIKMLKSATIHNSEEISSLKIVK